MTDEGKITPSPRTRIIGRRFVIWCSGGRHPKTSEHRTSTNGDGSDPKKTDTGSDLENFSPYIVNNLEVCALGFASMWRVPWCLGASDARSGGKYFTTEGKGVTGFEGIGYEPA
jgi:hypothetical protein